MYKSNHFNLLIPILYFVRIIVVGIDSRSPMLVCFSKSNIIIKETTYNQIVTASFWRRTILLSIILPASFTTEGIINPNKRINITKSKNC